MYMLPQKSIIACLLCLLFCLSACKKFEAFNENPNEPTTVSADVLLTAALRNSMQTMVTESFLLGNNAAQLSAKTLRTEVDAYNWNAFPTLWEGLYQSLTDVYAVQTQAVATENEQLEGVAIVVKSWIVATLTNAYGNIPYSQAIAGNNNNFTPEYDEQSFIYTHLLDELARANMLLSNGSGDIAGDIIFNGAAEKWQKLANSLRLRLLVTAQHKINDVATRFADIVTNAPIMQSNADNATLTYLETFPNQYPLISLKAGDFDAVALSENAYQVLQANKDPRLLRYARPDNDEYNDNALFSGAANGASSANCPKSGSRIGVQYFHAANSIQNTDLGLPTAEGIIMTYAEVAFLLAEAAAKSWIGESAAVYYADGIAASMDYHQVDYAAFDWESFGDFYENAGITYVDLNSIWEQKWLALFFHGLEPYFELRRWYIEKAMDWDALPFVSPACNNVNDDKLPLRFLYPDNEQTLNSENYSVAVNQLGGTNSQNARMWLVEE